MLPVLLLPVLLLPVLLRRLRLLCCQSERSRGRASARWAALV